MSVPGLGAMSLTTITVDVEPKLVTVGDAVKIFGEVKVLGLPPLTPVPVAIYLVDPDTGRAIKIGDTQTEWGTGRYSFTWTVPYSVEDVTIPCKRWKIRAAATTVFGIEMASAETSIPVAYKTSLSLSTDKDTYAPGETIQAAATLYYLTQQGLRPLQGATVSFFLKDSTGRIVAEASAATDNNGVARANLTAPSQEGTYTLEARFGGYGFTLSYESRETKILASQPVVF